MTNSLSQQKSGSPKSCKVHHIALREDYKPNPLLFSKLLEFPINTLPYSKEILALTK